MPEGIAVAGDAPAAFRPRRERRPDIDRAKGLAILLVVAGHLVANTVPEGVAWYEPARYALYRFHMPFFLYLSGMVTVLSGLLAAPSADWPRQIRRRALRLLPPFFAIGLLILAAKLALMQVVVVDNQPDGLWGGLAGLFWHTGHSPATSVWYLLVLFLCTVTALVLRGIGSTGLLLLGLLLQLPAVPEIAYLDRFAHHFLFFAAGVWVAERQDRLLPLMERWQPLWWALFLGSLALALTVWWNIVILDEWWGLVVCGLLSIPALHGLIRRPPINRWSWPIRLGRYAMVVYLFNTLAIGAAKALLIAAGIPYTAPNFALHLALAMAAGVFVPILLKQLILRRLPVLDRMTD